MIARLLLALTLILPAPGVRARDLPAAAEAGWLLRDAPPAVRAEARYRRVARDVWQGLLTDSCPPARPAGAPRRSPRARA